MIHVAEPDLSGNELAYVTECVESSWVSSIGRFILEFEAAVARVAGTRHAIATNNGTTALHLALVALGVGPGDEVIVPSLTYIATANAVRYCGATPVLADSELDTMNIDPVDLERRITSKTRGVIPVHLYGHPADMEAISQVAERHSLFVLEDAAEAHAATFGGRPVGSLSDAAIFSFFGNKIVTTGEGGAVTTDDDQLAERLRLLRGQGMDPTRRYWFPEVGFNYRMTNVAAAIGVAQLERLDVMLAARRRIADRYRENLAGDDRLVLPTTRDGCERVEWLYTVRIDGATAPERDALISSMHSEGIETRPVFIPLHLMPPDAAGQHLPVAERLGAEGISLPTHLNLTDADIDRVCETLGRCLAVLRSGG